MFWRKLSPLKNRSFFLFGTRGTGKTTWIEEQFKTSKDLYLDLLDDEVESRYSKRPGLLDAELNSLKSRNRLPRFVIIDEVQKVPKLLDIAQKWIQKEKLLFVLTGSSSRKLKRGSANLLGGRANTYALYPLTQKEIGKEFNLQEILEWGSLPECFGLKVDREKTSYLRSYCKTYLREEILVEQLIRKLPPFRVFLELIAQNNGKLLNMEKFGRDIGVDHKTIASYLEILEDTYLGILLKPHHPSLRKSQLQQPRFYLFDTGVKRQLDGTLGVPLQSSTSQFGELFESWLINEIYRSSQYAECDYAFSFYRSKHGAEVDLILSRGRNKIYIEIKSTKRIDEKEVLELSRLSKEFPANAEGKKRVLYLTRDPNAALIENVECLHYLTFLKEF